MKRQTVITPQVVISIVTGVIDIGQHDGKKVLDVVPVADWNEIH